MFGLSTLAAVALWLAELSTAEKWAYGSAFIVLVGVVGETIADLTKWIKNKRCRKIVEKVSALVLILGLTGDLVSISLARSELAVITREAGNAKNSAKEAADAAARANKYVDGIARLSWPRQLDGAKFVTLLEGKPQARVKLLYNPNDSEAWSFARDIYWWLGKGISNNKGAGWTVSLPQPIPPKVVNQRLSFPNAPVGMQFSGAYTRFGLTFRLRDTGVPSGVPSPTASACRMKPLSGTCLFFAKDALTDAVLLSMLPDERGGDMEGEYDDSLPDDLIVVIVGPKPPIWHLEKPEQK